jgi:hypothetical protein
MLERGVGPGLSPDPWLYATIYMTIVLTAGAFALQFIAMFYNIYNIIIWPCIKNARGLIYICNVYA